MGSPRLVTYAAATTTIFLFLGKKRPTSLGLVHVRAGSLSATAWAWYVPVPPSGLNNGATAPQCRRA